MQRWFLSWISWGRTQRYTWKPKMFGQRWCWPVSGVSICPPMGHSGRSGSTLSVETMCVGASCRPLLSFFWAFWVQPLSKTPSCPFSSQTEKCFLLENHWRTDPPSGSAITHTVKQKQLKMNIEFIRKDNIYHHFSIDKWQPNAKIVIRQSQVYSVMNWGLHEQR